jgi:UDP-N-acetylglucosamine 3-dehydrogenase
MYARRNIPAAIGAAVLPKIGPIIGDGVHDTDLMLWFSGAKVTSAYAQTVDVRHLKYPDLGWTMYRFDSGAIGVLEDVWFLPEGTPYAIDERMEIIGTEGSIQIQETGPNLAVQDSGGWHYPDTTYWPMLRGARRGALRDELDYFAQCIFNEQPPTIITPEESLEAARACLAAEESAATGRVVELDY